MAQRSGKPSDGEAERVESPPTVFISYRRSDTEDVASVLKRRLSDDVGNRYTFLDGEDLIAGQKWRYGLAAAMNDSDAAVFIIGAEWAGVESDGTRRIDEADDAVRNEVMLALGDDAGAVPIPVLVDVDSFPELPEQLKPLAEWQFVQVSRETVDNLDSAGYQKVLVGVWNALRSLHPGGVLIIGEDLARVALDRLVTELKESRIVDATDLSSFAAAAYLLTPRMVRKGARRWPDIIFVTDDDSPSEVFKARVLAAYHNNTVRRIAVVGPGAAAIGALVSGTATAAGAAPTASVTYFATGSQLAAAVPNPGTGLVSSVSTAWSSAATGTKIAVIGAMVGAFIASVAVIVAVIGNAPDDTHMTIALPPPTNTRIDRTRAPPTTYAPTTTQEGDGPEPTSPTTRPVEVADLSVTIVGDYGNAVIVTKNLGSATAENVRITTTAVPESEGCAGDTLSAGGEGEISLPPDTEHPIPAPLPRQAPTRGRVRVMCFLPTYAVTATATFDGEDVDPSNNSAERRFEPIEVPDVVGLSLAQAGETITAAGLEVGPITGDESCAPRDIGPTVRSQAPSANTEVAPQSEVALDMACPAPAVIDLTTQVP